MRYSFRRGNEDFFGLVVLFVLWCVSFFCFMLCLGGMDFCEGFKEIDDYFIMVGKCFYRVIGNSFCFVFIFYVWLRMWL